MTQGDDGGRGLGGGFLGGMSEERERGLRRLRLLDPSGATDFVAALEGFAPELARLVVEVAYGRVHVRDQLLARDRQLLTVTVLAAMGGCETQLRFHVDGALNVGVRPDEIVECLLLVAVYAGLPRSLNALGVVRGVFTERGVEHRPHA